MTDKKPDEQDNIISMKAARERVAREQAARKPSSPGPKPRLPVFLIFLGLLALVLAFKYLSGGMP